MGEEIPNLWPAEVSVKVLSPVAILRAQVPRLAQLTKGILLAEITSEDSRDHVRHSFDVIAPALENYRHRLLFVQHAKQLVYPVQVDSHEAASQDEFMKLVADILNSPEVRSVLHSLIARSNEAGLTSAAGAK
jgi:hypothetical protein